VDAMADTALKSHRMFGDGGLQQIANSYLHQAGPEGQQHLMQVAQRLNQQGQVETAAALHDALDGW
jgi:hypothetical protein